MSNKQASADHLLTTSVHEAFSWSPDMVIYHDKCADGIVAAWACWKRWGDAPEFRAANYGFSPPKDVVDKNILIVDFSYPQAQLEAMVEAGARSIVILDHHKTAQADLIAFTLEENWPREITARNVHFAFEQLEFACCPPIVGLFDMDRSGARMAWDFTHPGTRAPQLVQLTERYDLWRFQPGTRDAAEALHLSIQAQPMTIANMNMIHVEFQQGGEPIIRGQAILAWRQQLVEEIASRAHRRTLAGIDGVISVECPYSLVSAVGHYLLDQHPDAPFAAMSVTGEKAATWSLRSRDDRTDVSAVAKGQGGGGHRNAAGFRIEHPAEPAGEEPVAYLVQTDDERWLSWRDDDTPVADCDYKIVPLYARPAPSNPDRLVERKAAEAIRRAFFTSASGGSPRCHLSLAYQSIDEMHEAEDAIKAWAKSVLEPKP